MSSNSSDLLEAAANARTTSKDGIDTWKLTYKYKGYTVSWMQSPENLEALQNFEVREDDIYCVTYPKAGTHWIWEIISLVLAEGDVTKIDRSVMNTMLDLTVAPSPDKVQFATPGYKLVEAFPNPRLIPTHVMEPLAPPQWATKKPKIIYFARNPKDLLVSFYHFAKDTVDPEFSTWEGFMKLFLSDEIPNGSWFDHVLRYWKHKDEPNFLFLKYEDCHKDLKSNVEKVARFLGKDLSDDVIASITDQCTLKGMKQAYNKIEEDFPEAGKVFTHFFGQIPFLRKGVVGDWKNYFTVKQNELFDKYYEEKMAGSGLTFDFEL